MFRQGSLNINGKFEMGVILHEKQVERNKLFSFVFENIKIENLSRILEFN